MKILMAVIVAISLAGAVSADDNTDNTDPSMAERIAAAKARLDARTAAAKAAATQPAKVEAAGPAVVTKPPSHSRTTTVRTYDRFIDATTVATEKITPELTKDAFGLSELRINAVATFKGKELGRQTPEYALFISLIRETDRSTTNENDKLILLVDGVPMNLPASNGPVIEVRIDSDKLKAISTAKKVEGQICSGLTEFRLSTVQIAQIADLYGQTTGADTLTPPGNPSKDVKGNVADPVGIIIADAIAHRTFVNGMTVEEASRAAHAQPKLIKTEGDSKTYRWDIRGQTATRTVTHRDALGGSHDETVADYGVVNFVTATFIDGKLSDFHKDH